MVNRTGHLRVNVHDVARHDRADTRHDDRPIGGLELLRNDRHGRHRHLRLWHRSRALKMPRRQATGANCNTEAEHDNAFLHGFHLLSDGLPRWPASTDDIGIRGQPSQTDEPHLVITSANIPHQARLTMFPVPWFGFEKTRKRSSLVACGASRPRLKETDVAGSAHHRRRCSGNRPLFPCCRAFAAAISYATRRLDPSQRQCTGCPGIWFGAGATGNYACVGVAWETVIQLQANGQG
jgi:hypothetical protein